MGVVLVGAQWGDEGKGKMTDYFAAEADVVVRYQGGSNAGHTVVVNGVEHRFHLIPSGILAGKLSVIGNGVVVDLGLILEEIGRLKEAGHDLSVLRISDAAHVIMPHHRMIDAAEERMRGAESLGTTGRGIGPAYRDKAARWGLRIADLMNPSVAHSRIRQQIARINPFLERVYELEPVDADDVIEQYRAYAQMIEPYVCETSQLINGALEAGDRVLFEGAQGTMLDVDLGTYPYVTSSNPIAGGACVGAGVGPTRIRRVVGVVKAYTSRVGSGPFPTELHGDMGDLLREKGHEYGTLTGRPRRCGWLDMVVLRHAVRVNGIGAISLTKLDVLSGFENLKIATAYRHRGRWIDEYPLDLEVFSTCEPEYIEMPGWTSDIQAARRWEDLPGAAMDYVRMVEDVTGARVINISVGPDREQTIPLEQMFPQD